MAKPKPVTSPASLTLHHQLGGPLVGVDAVARNTRVFAGVEDVEAGDGERVVHLVLEDALSDLVVDRLVVLAPVDAQSHLLLGVSGRRTRQLRLRVLVHGDVERSYLDARFPCNMQHVN